MGSTIFHPGIQGPTAPMVDANFANDPEAAHIVLRSGADITLVGMDVTMTTLLTTGMIDEVAREGDEAAKTLMRMTEFYVKAYKRIYPGIAGCGLHDPLAVAVAEDPSLARTERMFVDVELHGELTRGQTIADRRLTAVALHNADVCMDIDRPRFLANFLAAIKGR
jgi:purine nucleosidase